MFQQQNQKPIVLSGCNDSLSRKLPPVGTELSMAAHKLGRLWVVYFRQQFCFLKLRMYEKGKNM